MKRPRSSTTGNATASRARGMTYGTCADRDINISRILSDHARVRARGIPEEVVTAWRERVFGDILNDPVRVAVQEAVQRFGREEDFRIWAWYANRIGVNNFCELLFEQESIMKTYSLRNPAGAFHARLKSFYNASLSPTKGGMR